MIAASVIARLQDRCGGLFSLIDGAAALAEVKEHPTAHPAAFVVVVREASQENARLTGPVLQRSEIDFAVVIVASNLSDHRGGAAAGDVDALKRAVRAALIGWTPEGAEDVVTHVSGELTKSRGGSVWWEDTFATAAFLEEEP